MHWSAIDKEHVYTDHTASCFGINHIVIQLNLSTISHSDLYIYIYTVIHNNQSINPLQLD